MSDVLQHYGIRGMKWGVRRFQQKDGSLTPQGRKRYGGEDGPELQKSASVFSTPVSQLRIPGPSPGSSVQQTVKTVASATKQASAAKPPPAYDFAALMKQNDELLKKMYADLLS